MREMFRREIDILIFFYFTKIFLLIFFIGLPEIRKYFKSFIYKVTFITLIDNQVYSFYTFIRFLVSLVVLLTFRKNFRHLRQMILKKCQ